MLTCQESATYFYSAGEGITVEASAELHHHLLAQALISNYEAKLVPCQTGISDTEIAALDVNFSFDFLEFLDQLKSVGWPAR